METRQALGQKWGVTMEDSVPGHSFTNLLLIVGQSFIQYLPTLSLVSSIVFIGAYLSGEVLWWK